MSRSFGQHGLLENDLWSEGTAKVMLDVRVARYGADAGCNTTDAHRGSITSEVERALGIRSASRTQVQYTCCK